MSKMPPGVVEEQTPGEFIAQAEATLTAWGLPVNGDTRAAFMVGHDAGHAQGIKDAEAIVDRLFADLRKR